MLPVQRSDPLGQFILSQAPGSSANFQALITTTGFDPRQDVAEVLAASTGDPAKSRHGVVLVREARSNPI